MIIIYQYHNNLHQISKIADVIIAIYKRTKDSLNQDYVILKNKFPSYFPKKVQYDLHKPRTCIVLNIMMNLPVVYILVNICVSGIKKSQKPNSIYHLQCRQIHAHLP